MPVRSRAGLFIAPLLGAAVAFASAHAAMADQAAREHGHGPQGGAPTSSSQALPRAIPTSQAAHAVGNLQVFVPSAPSQQALHGLCRAFLKSTDLGKNGNPFEVLIGATGGNPATTSTWCQTYLTLWQAGKTGQR